MRKRGAVLAVLVGALVLAGVGPLTAGWNPDAPGETGLQGITGEEVRAAVEQFRKRDPSMQKFFDKAHGYAVFPTVAKGGMGIGGAYGEGQVFALGRMVGRSSLTQITIGFQFGGQAYSEIIFFKDRKALERFQGGGFELSAQASAVAATAGASANADYSDGVAIFTTTKAGLMYEATVGGQKFTYTPLP